VVMVACEKGLGLVKEALMAGALLDTLLFGFAGTRKGTPRLHGSSQLLRFSTRRVDDGCKRKATAFPWT
jgi:hypothetical protein